MRVLITGGAGYIGTHILTEILPSDHDILVIDNHINSSPLSLNRVQQITNKTFSKIKLDLTNANKLHNVFKEFQPEVVIHLAGLKAVDESNLKPILYYKNNVGGTLSLLESMSKFGCQKIIFSSSATVYGKPVYLPFDESHPTEPLNPYGKSKLFCEEIIKDWSNLQDNRTAIILRYFNPIGAHASGLIGDNPDGIPNNLLPYITKVAVGKCKNLLIYGNDYNTVDGTGMRDYIHVMDLARGHKVALDYSCFHTGYKVFNLGRGKANSVYEIISTFAKETGIDIPYEITSRRKGDIATSYSDIKKSKTILNWEARLSLTDMIRDSWKWQSNNPNGFST